MPGPAGGYAAPPDNYLVWAILSTMLCCLPLGIVSIVKSSSVNTLWAQGQYDAARQASADAKKWAMWAAIVGLVAGALYVLLFLGLGLAGSNRY
jgi:hypothetical protein